MQQQPLGGESAYDDPSNPYAAFGMTAEQAPADARATFIRQTYIHLTAAIYGFAAITYAIFQLFDVDALMQQFFNIPYAMLIALGGFLLVSFVADRWARSDTFYPEQNIILLAGVTTLVLFGALTAVVFISGADFSFMRTGLMFAGIVAFGLILASALLGFHLGVFFTIGMIAFAGAYILYDTSNILHHYRTDQHVAASLALFASVALLFWYVLQLFMSRD